MKKCNEPCEIFSRVCGYFRPVSNWNHGKREEFKDRKTFNVKAGMACAVLALSLLTGCATETIAQGLTTKNVSGNGTLIDSHVGINTDTKIPELKTTFISGDFSTEKSGTNHVSYREESNSSIWNASCVTKKRFLSITLTDAGNVPDAIRAVAEVFKTAEAKNTEQAETKKTEAEKRGKNGHAGR